MEDILKNSIPHMQARLKAVLQNNARVKTKLTTSGRLVPSRLAHFQTSELLFEEKIPNTGKKYKCSNLTLNNIINYKTFKDVK